MRKLFIKLSALSLSILPVTNIVSCTSAPNKNPTATTDVEFTQTDYAVLKGQNISVSVSNFRKLSMKGFSSTFSTKSSDTNIATNLPSSSDGGDSDNSVSVLVQGVNVGTSTFTVTFTNLSTQETATGTFTIHVLDFSDTQIDWDGTTQDTALDIYSSGTYVIFGKIKNFENFKDDNLNYDYTNGFTVSLSLDDSAQNLSNYLETDGIIDSQGQVCFKLKAPNTKDDSRWTENKNGKSIQITVSNGALGITGIKSESEFVKDYGGGASVAAKTHDLNFNNVSSSKIAEDTATDSTFNKNSDGTYTVVYSLTSDTVDDLDINSSDFNDASTIEMGNDNVALVKNEITGKNEYSVTFKLTKSDPFSAFNITIYLVFNRKDTKDDDSKKLKFTGTILQGFIDYLTPVPGVDGFTVGETSLTDDVNYTVNTKKYTPMDVTIPFKASNTIINSMESSGYSFSQWLVVGIDNPILNKLNPDPSDPYNSNCITQSVIDSTKDISKTSLPFDVNNISFVNSSIKITGTGVVRFSEQTDMYLLLVYKNSSNNVVVGNVHLTFDRVTDTSYSSYIDTSGIASSNEIFDSSDSTNTALKLHDGLSISTGLEMSIEDKDLKLKIGRINNNQSNEDYSRWGVSSSNKKLIKFDSNPVAKDGTVSLIQTGQGANDITNSYVTLTFTNPDNNNDTIKITLYTSAFVGAESAQLDLSSFLTDTSASTTVSNSLFTTSITTKKALNGVIEFNKDIDTLEYSRLACALVDLQPSPAYSNINNYVVFDSDINAQTGFIINTGYYSGYNKKIIFNGNIDFLSVSNMSSSGSSFGSGILNTNVNAVKGYFAAGATFNGKVSITTTTAESSNLSSFGVGVISTGATSELGDIFFNDSVKVDVGWKNGAAASGLLVAVKSYFSYYPEASNFTITAKDVEIDGDYAVTKGLVDDYAGYIRTTDSSATKIKVDSLTLGKTDSSVGATSSNGYGNAIYSRINGTGATSGDAGACLGDINIGSYTDLDASNEDAASILKIKGGLSPDSNNEIASITVGNYSSAVYKTLLSKYMQVGTTKIPLVIKKVADL